MGSPGRSYGPAGPAASPVWAQIHVPGWCPPTLPSVPRPQRVSSPLRCASHLCAPHLSAPLTSLRLCPWPCLVPSLGGTCEFLLYEPSNGQDLGSADEKQVGKRPSMDGYPRTLPYVRWGGQGGHSVGRWECLHQAQAPEALGASRRGESPTQFHMFKRQIQVRVWALQPDPLSSNLSSAT